MSTSGLPAWIARNLPEPLRQPTRPARNPVQATLEADRQDAVLDASFFHILQ